MHRHWGSLTLTRLIEDPSEPKCHSALTLWPPWTAQRTYYQLVPPVFLLEGQMNCQLRELGSCIGGLTNEGDGCMSRLKNWVDKVIDGWVHASMGKWLVG